VLQPRKFRRENFRESFAKISAQKIEYFQNFGTIFTILTKTEISEKIVFVISQLIFLGGREIAQEGGKILPKVSPKC